MGKLYNNSWAIIIGINDLEDKNAPFHVLKNAQNDAKLIEEILISKCDFPLSNISRLYGKDATKDRIEDLIENTLVSQIKDGDRFLFFFAGHAITRAKTAKKEPRLSKEAIKSIEQARERMRKGKFLTEEEAKKRLGI